MPARTTMLTREPPQRAPDPLPEVDVILGQAGSPTGISAVTCPRLARLQSALQVSNSPRHDRSMSFRTSR
jgi:hypothetical protein